GVGQVRYLCKRLRHRFDDLSIVVGRWGFAGDTMRMSATLQTRGASHVATTIAGVLEIIHRVPRLPSASAEIHEAADGAVRVERAKANTPHSPDRPATANT